ncbi:MAG: [FeFe] hydrogenase H-cluster radical SAM maturase HydE [Bacteroidetes bacterium]|nr:[FeFe] hydrogenase H-cluster radical SAM maturase HydE [Bacteroidota bacterium]
MADVIKLLDQAYFSKDDLVSLLAADESDTKLIFKKAAEVREKYVGKKVFFRGLIEYSNKCAKNCLYCGIRCGNTKVQRYEMTEEEVLEAATFAFKNNYGSIVIQSGERQDKRFTETIIHLLEKIKALSEGKLGVTLSLGEQTEETYKKWFDHGGHRYLLRIEVSNRELYAKLHPNDHLHSYDQRLEALKTLKKLGYQAGTGVMIGLPYQTIRDLADDLIFFREFDIDMIGMGPYIEHAETPLYGVYESVIPLNERFRLALKMIAILRIMMKDINIAATTAMQTIDKQGREKAIMVGANIIMPNLTPVKYRENYLLYENKPCIDEEAEECMSCLEARIHLAGATIGYGEWGDSKHFNHRFPTQPTD